MKKAASTYRHVLVRVLFPLSTFFVLALSLPGKAFALEGDTQVPPENGGNTAGSQGGLDVNFQLQNPLRGVNDVGSFIKKILDLVLTLGIPIVALFIIYSGFLFVTARGNSEKLGTAKKTFGYTLLGAAILLGSWVIAQALTQTVTDIGAGQ